MKVHSKPRYERTNFTRVVERYLTHSPPEKVIGELRVIIGNGDIRLASESLLGQIKEENVRTYIRCVLKRKTALWLYNTCILFKTSVHKSSLSRDKKVEAYTLIDRFEKVLMDGVAECHSARNPLQDAFTTYATAYNALLSGELSNAIKHRTILSEAKKRIEEMVRALNIEPGIYKRIWMLERRMKARFTTDLSLNVLKEYYEWTSLLTILDSMLDIHVVGNEGGKRVKRKTDVGITPKKKEVMDRG